MTLAAVLLLPLPRRLTWLDWIEQLNEEGVVDWLTYKKCVPTDFDPYIKKFNEAGPLPCPAVVLRASSYDAPLAACAPLVVRRSHAAWQAG